MSLKPVAMLIVASLWLSEMRAPADDVASPPPKKVALLVGVERYLKPGFNDLDYCEDDVLAVGEELRKLGFEVTILRGSAADEGQQATKANIEATTRRLVKPLGKQDLILIMFAGHGQTLNPDPNADPAELDLEKFEGYYCPYDAELNDAATQVSLNFLLDDILKKNVGRKLLVLDACRDIPADRNVAGRNARGIDASRIDLRTGTSVYLSCSFGQRSFEGTELRHGLFTHCLLDGLRGGAVRDGELTWVDLIGHVNRRMRAPDILQLMPPNERQVPFPAGDLTDTVLGRLAAQPTLPKHPATLTSAIGLELTLIPAGEFLMGGDQSPEEIVRVATASGGNTEAGYFADEQPQHTVRITQPFYMGIYEVTQAEWQAVMGSNPSYFSKTGGGKDKVSALATSIFPVEQVSWYDALEFCNQLSQRDGLTSCYTLTSIERNDEGSITSAQVAVASGGHQAAGSGYRLPTEAEWEYACRAGTTTPFHFGSSNNGTSANIDGNYPYGTATKVPRLNRTTSVGKYVANAFGLHDMHGNVYEWCFDRHDEAAYSSRSGTTSDLVVTSAAEDRRVLRGGSWLNVAWYSRSARRDRDAPDFRFNNTGFRVARTP